MKSILVTSVGNIGVGNQILCSLRMSNDPLYIVGTDISDKCIDIEMLNTFCLVPRSDQDSYKSIIKDIILTYNVGLVFVGSSSEATFFLNNLNYYLSLGVFVVLGSRELHDLCLNKCKLFDYLRSKGVLLSRYKKIDCVQDCEHIDFFPVVVKQNFQALASNHVYLAFDFTDLKLLSGYLINNGIDIIAQQWIGDSMNEFTVSVTSNTDGEVISSIAMRRNFESSISYKAKYVRNGKTYFISSGITQGKVEIIPKLSQQVEKIAWLLKSTGPLNLQGIWSNENFYLFDAHPAITSSVYMKALAGYNEPLYYVDRILAGKDHILASHEVEIVKKIFAEVKKG